MTRPHIIVHNDKHGPYALLSWTGADGNLTSEIVTPDEAKARAKQMEQET